MINPAIMYITPAIAQKERVYGSWLLMCAGISHLVAEHATTVVSDIGDDWSPKSPPLHTAPAISGIFTSMVKAIGITRGSTTAIVPHELPVEKAITIAIRKVMKGSSDGLRMLEKALARYSPVPSVVTKPPRPRANVSMIIAGSIPTQPSYNQWLASAKVRCFFTRIITNAMAIPESTPHRN